MRNNRLLPYETIVQAASGEPEAVGTVLQYYRRRIQCAARVNGRVDQDTCPHFFPLRQLVADEPRCVFCGDGGLNGDASAVLGMVEGEAPGVQHEAARACLLPLRVGIDRIADERVAEVQHVHTNLVGAPCVQGAHDQR